MRKNNIDIMYVECVSKTFAYNRLQLLNTCYCVVDDDEYDLYEFNEMIKNGDNICDCCDKMIIVYLSQISFEQQNDEYASSNLFECFTHVTVQEYDELQEDDELFVFTIEDYYYASECMIHDDDIESQNKITSIKIMCPCCKELYDSSLVDDVA